MLSRDTRWLEPLLALAVVVGVVRVGVMTLEGHLPLPFAPDRALLWSDWFDTAWWAHRPGAYDVWHSVYPPLSFVVLRMLGVGACYAQPTPALARACDWLGVASLHGVFVLNIVLLALSFRRIDPRTAPWRTIALGLGLPSLYGLAHGNLVLLCFTCVILGFGPLVRVPWLRWLAVGFAINFKLYVAAAILPLLAHRRWRQVAGMLAAASFVYLATYFWLGTGTPAAIHANLTAFSGRTLRSDEIRYATSYGPVMPLLSPSLRTFIPYAVLAVQALIAVALLAATLRPAGVPPHRLPLLGIALAVVSVETGGYAQAILLFFVFMERPTGVGRGIAVMLGYLLCFPFDIALGPITLGAVVRPAMVLGIAASFALLTLRDVRETHADARHSQ